jgi:multiple sugar transport system permease protein
MTRTKRHSPVLYGVVAVALSVILTLPIIVIFFASERLLTEGLTAGAEKG